MVDTLDDKEKIDDIQHIKVVTMTDQQSLDGLIHILFFFDIMFNAYLNTSLWAPSLWECFLEHI